METDSPPLAGEGLLVEDGPVGAEEGDGEEVLLVVLDTHVVHLAGGLRVGVEPSKHFPLGSGTFRKANMFTYCTKVRKNN